MKSSKTLFHEVMAGIHLRESPEEVKGIIFLLFESMFGLSRTDIMTGKGVPFPEEAATALQRAIDRLNEGEPVQYITGVESFCGRKFYVNPSVLIPRPETEELIRVVVDYYNAVLLKHGEHVPLKTLDIGTGSGCIPITLFHQIGPTEIYATDVSTAALSVAVGNAENLGATITFLEHDVLKEELPLSGLHVIVSNPPYITEKEKHEMNRNVLGHEPHQALFVPDDDPLIFYRAIARQAQKTLKTGGLLTVEINEKFGKEVANLFLENGFQQVQIIRDVAGKDRVVKGIQP